MIFNAVQVKYKYELLSKGKGFPVNAYTTIKYVLSIFVKAIFCFTLLSELALDLE